MTDSADAESVVADPNRIQEQNDQAVQRAKRLVAQLREVERYERTLDGKTDHNPKPNP